MSIYVELQVSKGSTFENVPDLAQKVADECEFEDYMAGDAFTAFVVLDGTEDVQFYQGAAGEDESDSYSPMLRIGVAPIKIAMHFATHLKDGSFVLTAVNEEGGQLRYQGTPGKVARIVINPEGRQHSDQGAPSKGGRPA